VTPGVWAATLALAALALLIVERIIWYWLDDTTTINDEDRP